MKNQLITHLTVFVSLAIIGFFNWSSAGGQETKKEERQLWQGAIDTGLSKLRIRFDVTKNTKGEYSGTIISVDQGNAKIPISKMEISGKDFFIEASSIPASYKGKLSGDQSKVVGKWKQGGGEIELIVKRVDEFSDAEHIESWTGTLVAGKQSFDFRVRIFKETDGTLSGKLDSFNEGFTGIPIALDLDDEGKFNFEVKVSAAKFEGKLNSDKTKIEGQWLQGGGKFPLEFEKTELNEERTVNRPQHPKKPYPYMEEQVSYKNETDDITLAATLTKPSGDGSFPAVVLISGSGAQDRDETIFQHKPFWVIADHLTKNGIAVLRFDERGVGQSTGSFAGATSEDFSRDVEAGIEYLKTRDEIDSNKIGLIGHSEGGMIAPLLAAKRDDVAMIVMLAGPGVDGAEIGISQSRAMGEAAGASKDVLDAQDKMLKLLFDAMKNDDQSPSQEFIDKVVAQFQSEIELEESPADLQENLKKRLQMINNPWFKYFVQYDPRPVLEKVKCPVLVLNGKKDLQVLVDLNVDAIDKALTAGGNKNFEVHKLDNLNHLFQETDGPGLVTEYGRLEETFSPVALNLMSDWLTKQVK